jgi:hypothetical protein
MSVEESPQSSVLHAGRYLRYVRFGVGIAPRPLGTWGSIT